ALWTWQRGQRRYCCMTRNGNPTVNGSTENPAQGVSAGADVRGRSLYREISGGFALSCHENHNSHKCSATSITFFMPKSLAYFFRRFDLASGGSDHGGGIQRSP